jgi:hypothetical protein
MTNKRIVGGTLFVLLCAFGSFGQAKKTNKTSTDLETTRVWHRQISKDEIDGDRVAYYLPSVEDAKVLLLVVCPNGKHGGLASLQFPFPLYGTTVSTLKYKSASGESKESDFGLTDASDAMVVSRVDAFKPLVGGTFRVEDGSGNLHTYHLPAVGTAPFDTGCAPAEKEGQKGNS